MAESRDEAWRGPERTSAMFEVGAVRARPVGATPFWVLLTVVAILYGSLLPLNFILPSMGDLANSFRAATELRPASFQDIVINVGVYAVLGTVLAAALSRRERSIGVVLVAAALFGGSVGAIAETLQLFLPARVTSSMDVVLNVFGSAMGACVWFAWQPVWPVLCAGLWRAWRDAPHQVAATALALSIVTYELFPFQLVLSTHQLHERFLAAKWNGFGLMIDSAESATLRPFVQEWLGALWFGVAGYALTLGAFESRPERTRALAMGVRGGVLLALVVEVMQLFSTLHVFEIGTIAVRSTAVAFGAAMAIPLLVGAPWTRAEDRARLLLPTRLLALLALAQAAGLILESIGTGRNSVVFDASFVTGVVPPFEKLWRAPMITAAAWVFPLVARVVVLVFTLLILARRWGAVRPAAVAVAGVLLTILLAEALSTATGASALDLTAPLLGVGAAVASLRVFTSIRAALLASAVSEIDRGRPEPASGGEIVLVRVRTRR